MQAAALNNFDTVWAALEQACSDPSLGKAGQNCISDRQAGSCAYKVKSVGSWQGGKWVPGQGGNGSGSACWNWFIGYRSPIADDPNVQPDPTPASSVASAVASGGPAGSGGGSSFIPSGLNLGSLLLPAGIIGGGLLLAAFMGGD